MEGLSSAVGAGGLTLWHVIWYVVIVVAATILLRSATPWGIGIRHDSLSYITAAQSLAGGGCLCRIGSGLEAKPLVHFGPLYPALLGLVTLITGNVLIAARWIASVLYGVNLAAWGMLVHVSSRRFWAGAVVTAILAVSSVMLQVHDAAMSEPLFLAILALALFFMTSYLSKGRRRDLWLVAGAVAAAVLTRYAAAFLIGLGVIAVLFLRKAPWRERLGDAARFMIGASGPVSIWLIRNVVVAGTATNRTLRWHPITVDDIRSFLRAATSWFTPRQYSHWIEGAVLVGFLLAAAIFLWSNRAKKSSDADSAAVLGMLLVGVVALYPAYLGISRSLFDDTIPIDDRMLSPMYVALTGLVGVLGAVVSSYRRGMWILLTAAALLLAGPLPHAVRRFEVKYESMRQDGVLFASRAWTKSESLAWARSLPADALVYSNQALITQFFTARPVYAIPESVDPVQRRARADFLDQLDRMYEDLQQPGSYLLVFDPENPMTPDDLQDEYRIGLNVVLTMSDGFVMVSPASGSGR